MNEIFIIGGGPGGVKLAQELRAIGFEGKIVLIEENLLGGECTNVGCIPSKTLYNFSKICYKIKKLTGKSFSFDTKLIVNTIRRVINTIRKGIELNLKNAEVEVINARAVIQGDKIFFNSSSYNFDCVAICTGSIPVTLGYKHDRILTNRELWGQMLEDFINALSKGAKVLIVGGGYIGLETACMFSNLFDGSQFIVVEKEKNILNTADDEIIQEIHKSITKNNPNINILTNCSVKDIQYGPNSLIVEYDISGEIFKDEFDFVLFSIGRKPNIPIRDMNKIEVNEFLEVKGMRNVWAIGDVIGGKLLAHKAEFQAKIASRNIIDKLQGKESRHRYTKTNELQIPSVMFTIPEVGWYGLTEKELKNMQVDFVSKKANIASNPRAIVDNSREGFVKILYNNRGEILGVHMIAENVSEIISVPMVYNSETIVYPHPTISEIFGELL